MPSLFSTGPERKGIETDAVEWVCASRGSALALKEKGLRRRNDLILLVLYRFSTGPERKGIETVQS